MRIMVLSDGGFKSAFITGLAVKECGHENVRILLIDNGVLNTAQKSATEHIAEHYEVPYTFIRQSCMLNGMFNMTLDVFTALSYAGKLGFDKIYYGASKADRGKFDYEMTHTHLRNMQLLVKCARLENRAVVMPEPEAPCMLLNIIQIVMLSKNYNVPLELTWNCSDPQIIRGKSVSCDKCDKCIEWTVAQRGLIRTKFSKFQPR